MLRLSAHVARVNLAVGLLAPTFDLVFIALNWFPNWHRFASCERRRK